MKKILIALMTCLLLALPISIFADSKYLFDDANLLTELEKTDLEGVLSETSLANNIDLVVVTVDSIGNKSATEYADDFYDYNGYKEDGAILLISMENRDVAISTSGIVADKISEETIDHIFDDIIPDLSDENYHKAFVTFAKDIDSYLNVEIHEPTFLERLLNSQNAIVSGIAAAIVSLISTLSMRRQLKSESRQRYAANYVENGSFRLTGYSDLLVNRRVSKVPINTNNNKPGGGMPSNNTNHIHISSSGHAHGGHSSHF